MRRRWTAVLSLAVLSLNLLATVLSLPMTTDASDRSALCLAQTITSSQEDPAQTEDSVKPSGFCVFCLPLLHAGPVGAQTSSEFIRFVVEAETPPPALSRQTALAHPPGTSAPRAPPAYS